MNRAPIRRLPVRPPQQSTQRGHFLETIKRGRALFPVNPLGFADNDEAERRNVTVLAAHVRSSGAPLAELAVLLDDGSICLVIDSRYPLADARKAHERAAGAATSKAISS